MIKKNDFVTSLTLSRYGGYKVKLALLKAGIITIKDLCQKTEEELSRLKFVKGGNLKGLKRALAYSGFSLCMTEEQIDAAETVFAEKVLGDIAS